MTSLSIRHTSPRLLVRLIEDPELPARMGALSQERFTGLVKEVGVADAGELVALATTQQLVAAFDEDLFVNARPGEREVFDRRRFVSWLEVLLEPGDEALARRAEELSEDFVAHALSSLILVFDYETLRERITAAPDGAEADEALERTLNEEIDGYLLVANQEAGWDAVLAFVLALDRCDRPLLVRILDRCVGASSSLVDDLEALTEALGITAALAALGRTAPAPFDERLRELAYLSNVVLAAATTQDGRRLHAAEAAEIAMTTVALGAELHARAKRRRSEARRRATPEELRAALAMCPADLLFRKASALMMTRKPERGDGLVRSRDELAEMVDAAGPRVLIVGNSGSGKSTRARALAREHDLAMLDLDTIAWSTPGVRRDLEQSAKELRAFIESHDGWVIEGCYASLVERALPHCTELLFLDPGVDACLANNLRRPWEPHKYASKEEQDANLEFLQDWVRQYYTRDDDYSHAAHLALFESFDGTKARIT